MAPEHRCSPYDKKRDYPYPQSVEREIVRELGAVYGPYTGNCFASTRQSDIEHVVATSEAHDSGMCAADRVTRARFARDLQNLTLASPEVNRRQKSGKDAGEWVPDRNRCWFAGRVLEVKRAYGLTVDRREAATLERILRGCASKAMEPVACDGIGAREGFWTGGRKRHRPARALRRQPEWQDHMQGGAAARDRTRAPVASRVPVHARRGRRWSRVRVRAGTGEEATSGRTRREA